MSRGGLGALALLLVGLASACGSSAHRVAAPAPSIVFESGDGCKQTYYAIHPNGSGLGRLFSTGHCGDVFWKPDGTQALVVPEEDDPSLRPYIVDLGSGKRQRVGVGGLYNANYPPDQVWSPNGKRMLLARGKPDYSGDNDVVYNPKTNTWLALHEKGQYGQPVWAADSKSVIYPTTHGIAEERLSGGTRMILRLPRANPGDVHVSSDGKWISFTTEGFGAEGIGGGNALYIVHTNGKGLRRIAQTDPYAAWSPAGERLSYQDSTGLHVADPATKRTSLVAHARSDAEIPVTTFWSPDGRWILYSDTDLRFGAPVDDHAQLWAVRPNGKDAHPVTAAFVGGLSLQAQADSWAGSNMRGKPVPRPTLIKAQGRPVLTTQLPIVALGALGQNVAVATGFGQQGVGVRQRRAPRGPIIRIGPNHRIHQRPLPKGCVTVSTLLLTATQLGYVCDNSPYEGSRYAFWLRGKKLLSVAGGQGVGTFLGGPVTDGRTIAYDVDNHPIGGPPYFKPRPSSTRIYELRGSSPKLVRTLPPGLRGATVESIDHGRIALSRYGHRQTVEVLSPDGSTRKFRFRADYLNGVALDGSRLVVLEDERLAVIDLATGRRHVWPTALSGNTYGKPLASVRGDLAAYIVGAAIHVMRLSDGHEVVIDTPGATSPVLAQFVGKGLFYAYNEAYAKEPGRVGFLSLESLERAISSEGRPAA